MHYLGNFHASWTNITVVMEFYVRSASCIFTGEGAKKDLFPWRAVLSSQSQPSWSCLKKALFSFSFRATAALCAEWPWRKSPRKSCPDARFHSSAEARDRKHSMPLEDFCRLPWPLGRAKPGTQRCQIQFATNHKFSKQNKKRGVFNFRKCAAALEDAGNSLLHVPSATKASPSSQRNRLSRWTWFWQRLCWYGIPAQILQPDSMEKVNEAQEKLRDCFNAG